MNLNLFDNSDGSVLRERENSLAEMSDNRFANGSVSRFPANTPLAMAYVPFQQWGEVYSDDEAFSIGTLYPQLNFPFEGGCSDE